jgi:hypothetical protein
MNLNPIVAYGDPAYGDPCVVFLKYIRIIISS